MKYLSLSDEADIAICEICEGEWPRSLGIEPECGDGWFCASCYKLHYCKVLLDSDGRKVEIGMRLHHIGDERIYQVIEIIPTFTAGQFCVGERVLKSKLDGGRHTMRTRLMKIID